MEGTIPDPDDIRPPDLVVDYDFRCEENEDPFALAREIAVEQTAEVPEDVIPPSVNERIVGRIERLDRVDHRHWRATIAYGRDALGPGLPSLLTVLYGNISMRISVRVTGVSWPTWLLDSLPGPAFGIDGLRAFHPHAADRPLLCSALKPLGLTTTQLARRAGAFARGGADFIKDDHGLHDQPSSPFAERVARCQEAVVEGREAAGTTTEYMPHIGGPIEGLGERVDRLRELSVKTAFVAPLVLGLDQFRHLAETSGLVLLAHPAMSGLFLHPEHGIAAPVYYGDLLRLIGADGVIYANAGGRFPYSESLCQTINQRLRRRLGPIRSSMPSPGGGVTVESAPYWTERYGSDTLFLIGGSLYQQGDVEAATRRLLEALTRAGSTPPAAG